jgi:hypothetical protein
MKKIIYGWLTFLTMPLTIIGYDKIVQVVNPSEAVQVILMLFSVFVLGFQFLMTASLIIHGWDEMNIKHPFKP